MMSTLTPAPTSGTPSFDPRATSYDRIGITLYDLFAANLAAGGGSVIEGRTFRNCRIAGPAVMLVLEGTTFHATNFGPSHGDIRSILFKPMSEKYALGAIPVRNCRFENCTFSALGITGHENFLNLIIEQVPAR
jgi:hypothetical protein